jgi:hypothetical protein
MTAIAVRSKTRRMNKVYPDAAAALADVSDGVSGCREIPSTASASSRVAS